MPLTLVIHAVSSIQFGTGTSLTGPVLTIDPDELRQLALEDDTLEGIDFEIARPGESLRAGPVFDIVEPRAKAPGGSPDWPGILGPPHTAGRGATHVLQGVAVTTLREESPGESRGATGYVLEMSGAAAAGSHYATLHHLIIVPHSRTGVPPHVRQRAYRSAQLKVAVHLARAAMNMRPTSVTDYDTTHGAEREGLLHVAY